MKRKYQFLFRILFVVPFILGIVGNHLGGKAWNDALYCTFCYYFVSVYDTSSFNILTEIARWTAPLMTVTGLLYGLRGFLRSIRIYLLSMRKDAVVIYYDHDRTAARTLSENIPKSFIQEFSEDEDGIFFHDVPRQILFFAEDETNLSFYEKYEKDLRTKQVYMKLVELDSNLFKPNNIHFFNVLELIAVQYWKLHPVLDQNRPEKKTFHIAIVGDNSLTEVMLIQGLIHNLFLADQKIVYHLYGRVDVMRNMLRDFDTMNGDEVVFEDVFWAAALPELAGMDRIILTDRKNPNILEKMIYTCPDTPVYYFAETSADPGRFFRAENIIPFGQQGRVLTYENILGDACYQQAKALHFITLPDYEDYLSGNVWIKERVKEAEWMKLDGFMQCSYRAIAGYYDLYAHLLTHGYPVSRDLDKIVRLEHIRWCRFYRLNHWQYGEPEEGALRNEKRHIHRALRPFDQLREEDVARERARIQFLIDAHEKYGGKV